MHQSAYQQFRVVGVEDGGFSKKTLDFGVSKALFVAVLFLGRRLYDFSWMK